MTDKRLRIISDGTSKNTVITFDGRSLDGYVTAVDIKIRPNDVVVATLEFVNVQLDICADAVKNFKKFVVVQDAVDGNWDTVEEVTP